MRLAIDFRDRVYVDPKVLRVRDLYTDIITGDCDSTPRHLFETSKHSTDSGVYKDVIAVYNRHQPACGR